MRWQDSAVVVTGASRGIGADVARQAAALGSRVGLIARPSADLDALQAELGPRCTVAAADVSDKEGVTAAVALIEAAQGSTDVLVNNAGIGLYGAFLDASDEDIERLMRTNYFGVVHLLKAVVPGMVDRRHGHVVTVASISGRIGSPFEAAYSATKFAVIGLSEALSVELAASNVAVSIVNPGPVDTPFFAARGHPYTRKHPRPVSSQRVAKAVIRAVEHGRSEVYSPWILHPALVVKTLIPPLFRIGTARAFSPELAEERQRSAGSKRA